MKQTRILNAKGKPIVLSDKEERLAIYNQKIVNALGYQIDITTLTAISKKVSEQKFYHIAPAKYMPVRVGFGSWNSSILTYRSFNMADDFATGVVNTGGGNDRLASADAGVDSVTVQIKNWAKEIGWSIMDLEMAAKAGNWDLVTEKERSRKLNWDLGIQKVAFLGLAGDTSALGLYTQGDVTVNLTTIPAALSSLSSIDLKAFCTTVLNDYRSNCARTAWPTHFIMPESDFLGLAAPVNAEFPIKSIMEQLLETFKIMTGNPNFQILPNSYGDTTYSGQTYQQYILLNYDETSGRMDIPVDYTNTLANSVNNFSFQNVGYGQFTGYKAYRPLEMLYYRYTP